MSSDMTVMALLRKKDPEIDGRYKRMGTSRRTAAQLPIASGKLRAMLARSRRISNIIAPRKQKIGNAAAM
jgi:hypothetical protein